jgi:deoxyribodipyrimidine photo-lyase
MDRSARNAVMRCAIVWFRRDLRLADQPALIRALTAADTVLPLYLHDDSADGDWPAGAASRAWLRRSLLALDAALRARGNRLWLRGGATLEVLRALVAQSGADALYWNRRHEPAARALEARVSDWASTLGIEALACNDSLLIEPGSLRTAQGRPYQVFTPFWRVAQTRLDALPAPLPAPQRIPAPDLPAGAADLASTLETLLPAPSPPWDTGFWTQWRPGEAGALEALDDCDDDLIAAYANDRDRPDRAGTTRLSPHLHFGEVSPRQLLARWRGRRGADPLLRQLGWREFARHLLHAAPHAVIRDHTEALRGFDWATPDPALLRAWQQGRSGVPIVDAGMRELWQDGWMHGRVRMIVASLLTKHLRYHWLHGARWFWDTLLDADLANNTLGWQWVAGTGVDAAPYFRVFNPVTQSRRFDPDGGYLRRWLPELRALPNAMIHAPWEQPALASALAPDYPAQPIVDLSHGREQALAAYRRRGR